MKCPCFCSWFQYVPPPKTHTEKLCIIPHEDSAAVDHYDPKTLAVFKCYFWLSSNLAGKTSIFFEKLGSGGLRVVSPFPHLHECLLYPAPGIQRLQQDFQGERRQLSGFAILLYLLVFFPPPNATRQRYTKRKLINSIIIIILIIFKEFKFVSPAERRTSVWLAWLPDYYHPVLPG